MLALATDPQFKLYAVCCIILSLQMLLLAGIIPARRAKHQGYLNPEDGKVSKKDAKLVDGAEHPAVARVLRAHRNMLESLPLFFAIGLIYVLSGASPLGAKICFPIFTGARVLHSIVYVRALQPWRTMFYAISALSLVAMSVLILVTLLA